VSSLENLIQLQASSPLLTSKIYRFNFCPASYIHPSRRRGFDDGKLSSLVWKTARSQPALSQFILKKLNIDEQASFDMNYPDWPLILLEPPQLSRLQRHIAAVLFNPRIRHSVRHDEVVAWRERLGVNAYKFALNGFNLLPRTVWPLVDHEIADLEAVSSGLLELAMSTAPRPLFLRAVLKLPDVSFAPKIELVFARNLIYSLMSILEPEWRSYFLATQQ